MKDAKQQLLVFAPVVYRGTSFDSIIDAIQATGIRADIKVQSMLENVLRGGTIDDVQFPKLQLSALENLSEYIDQYSHVLFIDFYNPGIEAIKSLIDTKGLDVKLGALLHGGTFFAHDLYSDKWLRFFEEAWFQVYDAVYVPSEYARSCIPEELQNKVTVKSWGLDHLFRHSPKKYKKEYDVVFPHRISSDKGIDELVSIAKNLSHVEFHVTTQSSAKVIYRLPPNVIIHNGTNRAEYYRILQKSKIVLSCGRQELFGYSVAEAVYFGACPVLPARECYSELYPAIDLYENVEQATKMISDILRDYKASNDPNTSLKQRSFRGLIDDFMAK